MQPPTDRDTWVGLSDAPLPLAAVSEWAVLPSSGAVVTFSGHVRDHSADRPGVDQVEYEAYEEQVAPRLAAVAAELRSRWPAVGRVALLHRIGSLSVTDCAVVVAVGAPHRDEAFEAARFGIDAVKASVPIWKRERWAGGESWGLEPQHVTSADRG